MDTPSWGAWCLSRSFLTPLQPEVGPKHLALARPGRADPTRAEAVMSAAGYPKEPWGRSGRRSDFMPVQKEVEFSLLSTILRVRGGTVVIREMFVCLP